MRNTKKEKCLLIISPFFSPNTGGVETHLDDLCQELSARNIKTQVITYQSLTTRVKGKRIEQRGSVTINRIKWYGHNLFHKIETNPLLVLVYLFPGIFIKSLFFMLKNKKQIAAIHSHGMLASFVVKLLKIIFKTKIVASTHAIYNFKSRPMLAKIVKFALSSFDQILAISRQSKQELASIGIEESRVIVYTYWVDQEIFTPLDKLKSKEELGWQDKFVVLFVGRLLEIKGIKLLLEVSKRFKDDLYLAVAGDGPLAAEIKKASLTNQRVIFSGRVDNRKLNTYYNAADIIVVPSLYEEAYGRIILEALSCGVPVIASRRGGMVEALSSRVGVLIEPTEDNIFETVSRLYKDKELLKFLSSGARTYALDNFSLKNVEIIINSYKLG